ncbi:MAG: hypothetical protein ABIQ74_01230 [Chitinophagales bacterium]
MKISYPVKNNGIDLLMKILAACVVCFIITNSYAQVSDISDVGDSSYYIAYIPKYECSAGIAHSYLPGIFTNGGFYPDNLEFSGWINQRLYWQAGIFFLHSVTEIIPADSLLNIPADTSLKSAYFQPGYAFYAGTTLKLFLFKNAYFTPALNLFFDKYQGDTRERWSVTMGPVAAFEYFVSNRFSLRADLFSFNLGIGSSGTFLITTHRVLGIGLRYSFDVQKKE